MRWIRIQDVFFLTAPISPPDYSGRGGGGGELQSIADEEEDYEEEDIMLDGCGKGDFPRKA